LLRWQIPYTPVIALHEDASLAAAAGIVREDHHYIHPIVDTQSRVVDQVQGELIERRA